jgi:hypothetical protein
MVADMTRLAPEFTLADFDPAPATGPLPLVVCWAIWIAASAGLWLIALRTAAWLF